MKKRQVDDIKHHLHANNRTNPYPVGFIFPVAFVVTTKYTHVLRNTVFPVVSWGSYISHTFQPRYNILVHSIQIHQHPDNMGQKANRFNKYSLR